MTDPTGDGFHRLAWLIIAEGGWWTPQEVIERMPSDCEVRCPNNSLWMMSRRYGSLAVRGERRKPEYAVTDDCKIPPGVRVGDFLRATRGSE